MGECPPPGSARVPPAQHWQNLAHLLGPDRLAKTPGLCLGLAPAVPAGRVDGCAIAGKLSGTQRDSMRARRPRSRVGRFRHDCPSRESRCKRTGRLVALNPGLTIPWCPSCNFVDHSFFFFFRLVTLAPFSGYWGEGVSVASRFRPSAVAAFAARRGATPFHGLTPTATCCRGFAARLVARAFARRLSIAS